MIRAERSAEHVLGQGNCQTVPARNVAFHDQVLLYEHYLLRRDALAVDTRCSRDTWRTGLVSLVFV